MELESELRAVAAEIEWPQTPALRPELAPGRRLMRRGRAVAFAAAVVAAALVAVFAVPQSRGAILRFLGLGSVHVEFVERLPAAQERPLAAGLGPAISAAVAHGLLGRPPLEPPLAPAPALHAQGGIVSLLFLHAGEPVLLSEIAGGSTVIKKIAVTSTSVRWRSIANDPAIWIAGDRHVVVFPHAAPRLAGHVLVWQHGNLTLRLEGAQLTIRDALGLAEKIRAAAARDTA
ncbi:MAG: hypothetical protein ACJ75G_00055 [Gaiellaceae bacterium]